jgi:hypothetical protein
MCIISLLVLFIHPAVSEMSLAVSLEIIKESNSQSTVIVTYKHVVKL